jgi:hypothetical protein
MITLGALGGAGAVAGWFITYIIEETTAMITIAIPTMIQMSFLRRAGLSFVIRRCLLRFARLAASFALSN